MIHIRAFWSGVLAWQGDYPKLTSPGLLNIDPLWRYDVWVT